MHITERDDWRARHFLIIVMMPHRLDVVINTIYSGASCCLHAFSARELRARGQPRRFQSYSFAASINPHELSRRCAMTNLILHTNLLIRPRPLHLPQGITYTDMLKIDRGISRAMRDGSLPRACQPLFLSAPIRITEMVAPGAISRTRPAILAQVGMSWGDVGNNLDHRTVTLVSVMRANLMSREPRSKRSTLRSNRMRRASILQPPADDTRDDDVVEDEEDE